MKNKANRKQEPKTKAAPITKKKNPLWMVIIFMLVATIGIVLWRNYTAGKIIKSASPAASPASTPTQVNKDQLAGRWVRTDSEGNYIIEIKSAAVDGKLAASYFNPNPIQVGHAEWQKKNKGLMIVVELRDVNYPGSTYTLDFLPAEDRMIGNYYQAVEGTNFDVEFVRER